MLLDSNILIYAVQAQHTALRQWLAQQTDLSVSEISRLDVLSYHRLTETDKQDLDRMFNQLKRYPISTTIIAATALTHRQTLVTRNVEDFSWLAALTVINPFAQ